MTTSPYLEARAKHGRVVRGTTDDGLATVVAYYLAHEDAGVYGCGRDCVCEPQLQLILTSQIEP